MKLNELKVQRERQMTNWLKMSHALGSNEIFPDYKNLQKGNKFSLVIRLIL